MPLKEVSSGIEMEKAVSRHHTNMILKSDKIDLPTYVHAYVCIL